MLLTISFILIVTFSVMNLTNGIGTKSEFQQKVDSALDAIKDDTKKDTVITIKSGTTKMVIRVKK